MSMLIGLHLKFRHLISSELLSYRAPHSRSTKLIGGSNSAFLSLRGTARVKDSSFAASVPQCGFATMAGCSEFNRDAGAKMVTIMPCDSSGGSMLSLCHPKSGEEACYILMGDNICEVNWFKQSFGSWFLGDYVCEDGSLYMCTPVDPIFILLPIFSSSCFSNGNNPGKFRQLDEILYVDGYPAYQMLISIAENHMQIVCETKEIGSEKFYRLDDSKVLAWLYCKVQNLKETFPKLGKNYAAQEEKDLLKEIILILGEYVKDEPWLKLLCTKLKIDINDAYITTTHSNGEITPMPSTTSKGNVANGPSKSTKGRPQKKIKTQVESKNIKDMFRRVTRNGPK